MVARVNRIVTSGLSCEQVIEEYADVFEDVVGCLPGEYDIKLDASVTPVVHPPR
jgi:hypothetical protein